MNFEKEIRPFIWAKDEDTFSVCLNVGEYCAPLFKTRASEGFLGNGYDWESLAMVFLEEKMPEIIDSIEFDSEAGMFCAYSSSLKSLKAFILAFKKACENESLIKDLFSRAELQ